MGFKRFLIACTAEIFEWILSRKRSETWNSLDAPAIGNLQTWILNPDVSPQVPLGSFAATNSVVPSEGKGLFGAARLDSVDQDCPGAAPSITTITNPYAPLL